jgi:hypothetical protein
LQDDILSGYLFTCIEKSEVITETGSSSFYFYYSAVFSIEVPVCFFSW